MPNDNNPNINSAPLNPHESVFPFVDNPAENKSGGVEEKPTTPGSYSALPSEPAAGSDKVISPIPTPSAPLPTTISPQTPTKYGGKKVIATIFGVLLLLSSVAVGVYLVQKNAEYRGRASSGKECSQSPDCKLLDNPGNSGQDNTPRPITYLYVTAQTAIKFDQPLTDDGCYRVAISGTHLEWQRHGDGPDCKDISNIQIWMSSTSSTPTTQPTGESGHKINICHVPPGSPQNAQTIEVDKSSWEAGHDPHNAHNMDYVIENGKTCPPGATSTPVPTTQPQISASCSAVQAYDSSWNTLSADKLSKLKPGASIRFTVSGTADSGSFDRAKFTINQVDIESSVKRPGSDDFYIEYQIPQNQAQFTVTAKVHHSVLGWF